MTVDEMFDHLQRIRTASDGMLQAAREGRWDDVGELDGQRATLIQAWGAAAETLARTIGDDTAEVEACLRHIVDVNNEVMDLAAEYRDRLAGQLSGNRQQRQAAGAYAAAAR